ncbi:low molecular weight phosphatase family protein [Planococcus halotolerans]|uniref:Phosphatase n=1 Tax=Planococcus halotolerans TaxID=2233542 RepID=A0A365KNM1_9BACL|nr:phosphatase [Planococcus halotolerans]QHJ71926.1 phosphatase [Planococcus halotolerans]RAZ74685.1 phosphatase [Planococcus halotolerans]
MSKQTVYFLSSHQHRGLMAEIWANRLELPDWEIRSAAWSQPSISETPMEIMKEIILDLPEVESRSYNHDEVSEADLIIAMHDGELEQDDIPADLPAQKLLRWDIRNPELRSLDETEQWALYQEICDEIAMNIKNMETYFRSDYM